jgi:sRNA-binding regulator protein Hfq
MATNPNAARPVLHLKMCAAQRPVDARLVPSGTSIAGLAVKPASAAASPAASGDSSLGKTFAPGSDSAQPAPPAAPPPMADGTPPKAKPKKPRPPDLDLVTGPEQNFLGWAKRMKFPVRFTCLDGSIVEGVVTDRDRFTVGLRGDRVIFKHAIRDMQALPESDTQCPVMSTEDTAKKAAE